MPTLIVSNPVCGASKGQTFIEENVVPLLKQHSKNVNKVAVTEYAGHAGEIVIEFLKTTNEPITVILSSGDGTLHEIIDAIVQAQRSSQGLQANISFVLVPTGTANALYSTLFPPSPADDTGEPSYMLQAVNAFLSNYQTIPLTLAITSFISASETELQSIASTVVVSTSLHASILHDSELLRKEIPDLSRFKVAAGQNISRWYDSTVRLLPGPTGRVQIFNPLLSSFEDHPNSAGDSAEVLLEGPFEYFLSVVNVDRLEPAFRIAPLQLRAGSSEVGYMDIVIVRPKRDPTYVDDGEESRQRFVSKASTILGGAYQQGAHVNLRYKSSGELSTDGDGVTAVEYIRCSGWEWMPNEQDEHARLVCCDGAIVSIEKKGKAICKTAPPTSDLNLRVYG